MKRLAVYWRLAPAAIACLIGSISAQATPISYTLTGTGSGTLGASSFTNALVTVTLTGDTANVSPFAGSSSAVQNVGIGTVTVAGLGSALFTGPIEVNSTMNDLSFLGVPALVIGNPGPNGTGILGQIGSPFSTYDLRSPLGPVSGTGGVFSGSHITPVFPTTAGNFTWAIGQDLGSSTFTATALGSLSDYQGGTSSTPIFLVGSQVGAVTGAIGGAITQDYYSFLWNGGPFSATATVKGATAGSFYSFSEGVTGSCNSVASPKLSSTNNFTGTISIANLAAGTYCIGLGTTSSIDPTVSLTFNTPVSGVPEPSSSVLFSIGLGTVAFFRLKTRYWS